MFRADLLSIIRNLNNVYTAMGICHSSYVDCLLARSGWNILTSLGLLGVKCVFFSTPQILFVTFLFPINI